MSAAPSASLSAAPALAEPHISFWYPPLSVRALDDGCPTLTSREQADVERRVDEALRFVLPRAPTARNNSGGRRSKQASIFGGDDDDAEVDAELVCGSAAASSPSPTPVPQLTACPSLCELSREMHATYLLAGLMGSGCHSSLDASRPWLVYWALHGLDVLGLLERQVSPELAAATVAFLQRCVHPQGGIGGGPGQQSHTAPTYAAVLSLCILSSHSAVSSQALAVLRSARKGIYSFFLRCKESGGVGGFRVSRDGEVDTRGAYTVLAVASLLRIQTPTLTRGVARWVASCQTYEGGLGGEPGNEAHGGYTFCGLAALVLLRSPSLLHLPSLAKWASQRQMDREGGFQGRTNKLVDGCYSFWVGALFPILQRVMPGGRQEEDAQEEDADTLFPAPHEAGAAAANASTAAPSSSSSPSPSPSPLPSSSVAPAPTPASTPPAAPSCPCLFDTLALQRYILVACQSPLGGLRDKPGKHPDAYHTCYCLAGLSVAQHSRGGEVGEVLGRRENVVAPVHPIYNLRYAHVHRVRQAFANESEQELDA